MSLKASHYLDALRACGRVIDKPGGRQAQKAAVTALAMLQDMRENGWLTGRQGEAAYTNAMEACVLAEDAWSALALLDCAEDDAVRRSMELRTAGMQVHGVCFSSHRFGLDLAYDYLLYASDPVVNVLPLLWKTWEEGDET